MKKISKREKARRHREKQLLKTPIENVKDARFAKHARVMQQRRDLVCAMRARAVPA